MAEVIVVPGGVQVITAGTQGPQGTQGPPGPAGPEGPQGVPGEGVPVGGTTGQYLAKASNADYDTEWVTGGGGGGAVDSVFGRTGVVTAQSGDYTAAQVTNAVSTSGSYANPSWITSLSSLKITGLGALAFQNSVSLVTDVTGTLPIANGGTGQTTANGALNAFLPAQTGRSGKVLQTDGSNTSWAAAATGSVTSVSVTTANGVSGSVSNPSTTPAITLTLGAITPTSINGVTLSGSGSPALAVTGTSSISGSNTGDQTITLTGDVTGSGTGSFATTIGAGVVTNTMLAGSIAASKLVGTDIATIGTVTAGTWSATTIAINKGGTGQTTASGAINALVPSQSGNGGKYLTTDGSSVSWGAISGGGYSLLFAQTADGTVSNTTTETTLANTGVGSLTLPANALAAGKTVRFTARGYYSTIGASPGTLQQKLKLGSATLLDTGAGSLFTSQTSAIWVFRGEITCRTAGASGTVYVQGERGIWSSSTATITFVGSTKNTTTITIDTTASLALDLTATFSVANSGNTITCTNLTVEVLG